MAKNKFTHTALTTSRQHFLYFRARFTNLLRDAKSRYMHLTFFIPSSVLSSFKIVEHYAFFFILSIIRIFDVILIVYLVLFSHCPSIHPLSGVFDCDFTMKRLYVTRMIRSLQQAANFIKDNVTVMMRIRFHEASIVVAKSNGFANACD